MVGSKRLLSVTGTFVRKWGGRGDEPGRFDHPWGIHAHGGLLYVSDRSRVQVFDAYGGLVDVHHVSGAGDLTGVSVGDAGDVWAADGRLGCVHRLGRKVSVEQAAREPARGAWKCESENLCACGV